MSSTWLVWLVAAKAVFEGTVQYRSHCTDMYMIILRYGLQGTDLHVVSHNHCLTNPMVSSTCAVSSNAEPP